MVEYLAGSVGIDIYPNTKGFGEELRRKLARYADDDFDVRVTPDVDMSRWRRKGVSRMMASSRMLRFVAMTPI